MTRTRLCSPLAAAALLASAVLGCGGNASPRPPPPSPGTGGASTDNGGGAGGPGIPVGGTGGAPGGPAATGGSGAGDGGSAGSAPVIADAAATPPSSADGSAGPPTESLDGGPPADAGPLAPPVAGQGPVAVGKIVFSQDFEQNMNGFERSPGGLPPDRVQIVDDPAQQRGKVVRIHFEQGDNFRTSAGTEPRSWFSSAPAYSARPNTVVSVAWGFMWENPSMGAHFAQIIRDGGPLWMMDVDVDGTLHGDVHRGTGSTGPVLKVEANKWYDFRVDTDYRAGGAIKFFVNGKMVGQGTGDGGANGRFDCGIYWYKGPQLSRTVYISNLSIAEQ